MGVSFGAIRDEAAIAPYGLVDFLDVLEAERSLYTSQAHLAQGERAVSQYLVRLYKALGGGWEEYLAREQKAHGQVFIY